MIVSGILQMFIVFGQEIDEAVILANKTSRRDTLQATHNVVHILTPLLKTVLK